jgi:hypothetical protein
MTNNYLSLEYQKRLIINETATIAPTSINSFKANCASIGKRARCCTIPIVS